METNLIKVNFMISTVAPHTRCVDWNNSDEDTRRFISRSHLTRGAWIEIYTQSLLRRLHSVAPHTRCVDWNHLFVSQPVIAFLSHLTRGAWIEINCSSCAVIVNGKVAPHTRCVDWNFHVFKQPNDVFSVSHLTRGAWIEISLSLISAWTVTGRTSHEVRGLKYIKVYFIFPVSPGRTSHEVRGLKCQ